MGKKNSNNIGGDDMKSEQGLQAVVLADSFTKTFRPITLEEPKVLLPLVNVPMLEYTLEFLAGSGVEEIFVVCCWYSEKVAEYLKNSRWADSTAPIVRTVVSRTSTNAGDALRDLEGNNEKKLIRSDPFVLVSGDVVSNIRLAPILEAHKARRKKDKNCIMTVVFKQASPVHGLRPLDEDLVVTLNKDTKQIVWYEDNSARGQVQIKEKGENDIFEEHPQLEIRYDLVDCHIDICTPEMLAKIADEYDYQDLRKHYLHNEVQNHEMMQRIFAHEITAATDYAARVHDLRTYDTVSKDIIQRWSYPLVPDNNWTNTSSYSHTYGFKYLAEEVSISRTCSLNDNTVIGEHSRVGDNTCISGSVLGRNCVVGRDVVIKNSYLWDEVVVEDGAVIENAVICNRARIGKDAKVARGTTISFDVRVAAGCSVPEFSQITTMAKQAGDRNGHRFGSFGSGDSFQFGSPVDEISSGLAQASLGAADDLGDGPAGARVGDSNITGTDGVGRLYTYEEDSDYDSDDDVTPKWRRAAIGTPLDTPAARDGLGATELVAMRNELWKDFTIDEADEEVENMEDPDGHFLRAIRELFGDTLQNLDRQTLDNLALEISGLKFSHNRQFDDCIFAVVPCLLLPLVNEARDTGVVNPQGVQTLVERCAPLLIRYIMGSSQQLALVEVLEYICEYGEHAGKVALWNKRKEDDTDAVDIAPKLEQSAQQALLNVFPVILLMLAFSKLINPGGLELWQSRRSTESDSESVRYKLFNNPETTRIVEHILDDEEESSEEESSEGEESED